MATPRPLQSSKSSSSSTMAATRNTVTTTLAAAAAAAAAAETQENVYQTCLGKLQPLVPVLAGFNHRNRSQHRHARWWAAFGSLRRNLGRLVADLEKAHALSKKSSSGSGGKKKRKREGKGDDDEEGPAAADGNGHHVKKGPVEVRAVWMRDHEVPGCYVAFSQLAADNQFAVLGLALLGILATVHDVCVRLVGEAPAVSKPAVSPSSLSVPVGRNLTSPGDAAAAKTGETKKSIGGGGGVMTPAAMDLGQVVSRKDVAAALASSSSSLLSKSKPPKACAQEDIASASTAFSRRVQDGQAPPPPPQPVRRKKKDPSTSKTASFTDSAPSTIKAAEKQSDGKVAKGDKIKKKKKKTKGDEFDALFSSLV